jgi:hypothetical protein
MAASVDADLRAARLAQRRLPAMRVAALRPTTIARTLSTTPSAGRVTSIAALALVGALVVSACAAPPSSRVKWRGIPLSEAPVAPVEVVDRATAARDGLRRRVVEVPVHPRASAYSAWLSFVHVAWRRGHQVVGDVAIHVGVQEDDQSYDCMIHLVKTPVGAAAPSSGSDATTEHLARRMHISTGQSQRTRCGRGRGCTTTMEPTSYATSYWQHSSGFGEWHMLWVPPHRRWQITSAAPVCVRIAAPLAAPVVRGLGYSAPTEPPATETAATVSAAGPGVAPAAP